MPFHTIPYHIITCHTIIPYHNISFHNIPYHNISYHTIQYHTIPIPYPVIYQCPSQAMDRAHRIGQMNPVTVYRLLGFHSTLVFRCVINKSNNLFRVLINFMKCNVLQRKVRLIRVYQGYRH